MQLPRKNMVREELSSMTLLYALVIVMVIIAFFFRSNLGDTFSLETVETVQEAVQTPYNQDQ